MAMDVGIDVQDAAEFTIYVSFNLSALFFMKLKMLISILYISLMLF